MKIPSALQILDSAPDAIFLISKNGNVAWMNRRAESLFGYSSAELLGKKIELLLPGHLRSVHKAHRASFNARPMTRPMGRGMLLLGERKDGSQFRVDVSLSLLDEESPKDVICIVRDLSKYLRP